MTGLRRIAISTEFGQFRPGKAASEPTHKIRPTLIHVSVGHIRQKLIKYDQRGVRNFRLRPQTKGKKWLQEAHLLDDVAWQDMRSRHKRIRVLFETPRSSCSFSRFVGVAQESMNHGFSAMGRHGSALARSASARHAGKRQVHRDLRIENLVSQRVQPWVPVFRRCPEKTHAPQPRTGQTPSFATDREHEHIPFCGPSDNVDFSLPAARMCGPAGKMRPRLVEFGKDCPRLGNSCQPRAAFGRP